MATIDDLRINPEIVCQLIVRAREFHAKELVTFSEDTPESEYEYDWAQILADHHDDLTYQEVSNVIEDLMDEEQVDLLALMYLGRGDFDDWFEAQEEAENDLPSDLVDYLLAHPFIADYLEKALDSLEGGCEE